MIPAAGGIASTFGGPKINGKAEVVNTENRTIPGLYAAGAAGGCMVFGRVAGRNAALRAKEQN